MTFVLNTADDCYGPGIVTVQVQPASKTVPGDDEMRLAMPLSARTSEEEFVEHQAASFVRP